MPKRVTDVFALGSLLLAACTCGGPSGVQGQSRPTSKIAVNKHAAADWSDAEIIGLVRAASEAQVAIATSAPGPVDAPIAAFAAEIAAQHRDVLARFDALAKELRLDAAKSEQRTNFEHASVSTRKDLLARPPTAWGEAFVEREVDLLDDLHDAVEAMADDADEDRLEDALEALAKLVDAQHDKATDLD